jgi:hypothetical protein
VATYTATKQQLVAALAECIDFTPAMAQEYGDFGSMADAILSHLTAHEPAQPVLTAADEIYRLPAERLAATLAAATEAGRELGQRRTDYRGDPTGAVPAPPSVKRRATGAA